MIATEKIKAAQKKSTESLQRYEQAIEKQAQAVASAEKEVETSRKTAQKDLAALKKLIDKTG